MFPVGDAASIKRRSGRKKYLSFICSFDASGCDTGNLEDQQCGTVLYGWTVLKSAPAWTEHQHSYVLIAKVWLNRRA